MTSVKHNSILNLIQVSMFHLSKAESSFRHCGERNSSMQGFDFAIQILEDLSFIFQETSQTDFRFSEDASSEIKLEFVRSKIFDLEPSTKGPSVQFF